MKTPLRKSAQKVGLLAVIAILVAGCSHMLTVTLEAESYSVTRYTNYAPVVMENVRNPSTHSFSDVVVTASCYNDQLESVKSEFASAPFAIVAGEAIPTLTLEHVDGWPYFIDFKVFCRFAVETQLELGKPQLKIALR